MGKLEKIALLNPCCFEIEFSEVLFCDILRENCKVIKRYKESTIQVILLYLKRITLLFKSTQRNYNLSGCVCSKFLS